MPRLTVQTRAPSSICLGLAGQMCSICSSKKREVRRKYKRAVGIRLQTRSVFLSVSLLVLCIPRGRVLSLGLNIACLPRPPNQSEGYSEPVKQVWAAGLSKGSLGFLETAVWIQTQTALTTGEISQRIVQGQVWNTVFVYSHWVDHLKVRA